MIKDDKRVLVGAAALAIAFEVTLIICVSEFERFAPAPFKPKASETQFIETEIVKLPEPPQPKLRSKEALPSPAKPEAVLSKDPNKGRKAKPNETEHLTDSNQTQAEAPLPPTHGAVALSTPSPVIPPYLRDRELKSSVVIEFQITSEGSVTPKLLGSSGNEELDQIAISTAKKWRFRPAEKDGHPIDAKVRLRIVFEVQ
jgi:protein TonB